MSKAAAGVLLGVGAVVAGAVAWWRSGNPATADSGGDYLTDSINWLASTVLPSAFGWRTPAAGKQFDPWFDDAGSQYGLPGGLLSRMAYQETGGSYRSDRVSPAGAVGLMQLMPIHWAAVNPRDAQASIFYAAKLMAGFYRKYGDWAKALAAYNGGPVALNKKIAKAGDDWLSLAGRETYNYVTQIGADVGIVSYGPAQDTA